jgi:hypothetical protein
VLYQAELHPEVDNPLPERSREPARVAGARSVLKPPSRSNANLPGPEHGQGLAPLHGSIEGKPVPKAKGLPVGRHTPAG